MWPCVQLEREGHIKGEVLDAGCGFGDNGARIPHALPIYRQSAWRRVVRMVH